MNPSIRLDDLREMRTFSPHVGYKIQYLCLKLTTLTVYMHVDSSLSRDEPTTRFRRLPTRYYSTVKALGTSIHNTLHHLPLKHSKEKPLISDHLVINFRHRFSSLVDISPKFFQILLSVLWKTVVI